MLLPNRFQLYNLHMNTTPLQLAIDRIAVARKYTVNLIDHIDPALWFQQPSGGVTHVAWQVGHLAFAEYRLALERVRGVLPGDAKLLPEAFTALFGRTSTPDADATKYPAPSEIRGVFDAVHAQVMQEAPAYRDMDIDRPTDKPHPAFTTKIGALLWCSMHEMTHAGQIGLLRRFLGMPPLW